MTVSWRARRRRTRAVRALILGTAIVVALTPFAWTALAAIGIQPDNHVAPPSWTGTPSLDHLAEVSIVEPTFWQELATSVGVSIAAAVLAVGLSIPAAYGLARSSSRATRRLQPGLLVLAALPVMAYVLPLRDLTARVGLLDTIPGIVLAETAASTPLAVYVFWAHFGNVPRDGEESARLDGAGAYSILARVVLPAAAPILAATAIVLFVLDWNQLLTPLVLTGIEVRTLPVVLTDFFTLEREVDWPTAAAALLVSLIPLILLVGVLHRVVERFSLASATSAG